MTRAADLLERIESRGLWAFFHKDWLLQIRADIRPQLPPEYAVFVESEAIVMSPDPDAALQVAGPDLSVARPESAAGRDAAGRRVTQAVLEVEETCELCTTYSLLIRRAPDNRIVATCEMLSPTNKGTFGPVHRETYLRKRDQYLASGINVLEIDALLQGERLLPRPLERLSQYRRNVWTLLHRDGKRRWRGWGWNIEEEVPVVPWDVEPELTVCVDLARTLNEAVTFNPWERLAGG